MQGGVSDRLKSVFICTCKLFILPIFENKYFNIFNCTLNYNQTIFYYYILKIILYCRK